MKIRHFSFSHKVLTESFRFLSGTRGTGVCVTVDLLRPHTTHPMAWKNLYIFEILASVKRWGEDYGVHDPGCGKNKFILSPDPRLLSIKRREFDGISVVLKNIYSIHISTFINGSSSVLRRQFFHSGHMVLIPFPSPTFGSSLLHTSLRFLGVPVHVLTYQLVSRKVLRTSSQFCSLDGETRHHFVIFCCFITGHHHLLVFMSYDFLSSALELEESRKEEHFRDFRFPFNWLQFSFSPSSNLVLKKGENK